MITALKHMLRRGMYRCVDLLVRPGKGRESNALLVIRLDAIGDYVLFRNFLEVLRQSSTYGGCHMTLLGNSAWRELAEQLDSGVVDRFVWLDRNRFGKNPFYRYGMLKKMASGGYTTLLHPTYARERDVGDNIVRLVGAKEKIGYDGDVFNLSEKEKAVGNAAYTKLIPAESGEVFEFYRNKHFFEYLLGTTLAIEKPSMACPQSDVGMPLPAKYAVLFIGASSPYRQWPMPFFGEIAVHLVDMHDLDIVFCGGPEDRAAGKAVTAFIPERCRGRVLDLTARTTLTQLCSVICHASLLVSNETSAPHFAVATDTPVAVIYNGKHYGRFTPYPAEMTACYSAVLHPAIGADTEAYMKRSNRRGYDARLDIGEITVAQVKGAVDRLLAKPACRTKGGAVHG